MSLILSGTDGVADVDGSAATPAIRGTDTNTGIFFPAADTIAFSEGGAEVARFDANGNLGLGVTPSAWNSAYRALDIGNSFGLIGASNAADLYANAFLNSGGSFIYKTTAAAAAYSLASGQHRWYTAPSGTAGNAISFTQAMTLDASGNLLVGKTTNTYGSTNRSVFEVNGASSSIIALQYGGANGFYLQVGSDAGYLWNSANTPTVFGTNNTERARIDSSGNLLVGASTVSTTGNGIKSSLKVSDVFFQADVRKADDAGADRIQVACVVAVKAPCVVGC